MNDLTVSSGAVLTNLQDASKFEQLQRAAKMIASSDLVPKEFQYAVKKEQAIANVFIALELSDRLKASPFMVMQNLYVVYGKPSFSSSFLIACLNSSGKFAPLKFKIEGEGDKKTCIAWTTDETGTVLESPAVSIDMAKKEGWYSKNGSKWQTMPEVMLRYRAASFFARLYAPEIAMGMQTYEEIKDVEQPSYAEVDLQIPNLTITKLDTSLEVESVTAAEPAVKPQETAVPVVAEVTTEEPTKEAEKPAEQPETVTIESVLAKANQAKNITELRQITEAYKGFIGSLKVADKQKVVTELNKIEYALSKAKK